MGTMPSWTMIIKENGFNYNFSNTNVISVIMGFSGGPDGKETTYNARDLGSIPRLGRFSGRRIPVFLPGEFHGLSRGVTKSWMLSDFHFYFTMEAQYEI